MLTLRVTPTSPYNIIMAMGPCGLVGMARKPHRPGSAGSRAPLPRACAYKHGNCGGGCGCRAGVRHARVPVPSAKLQLAQWPWPGACAACRSSKEAPHAGAAGVGCGQRAWGPRDAGPVPPAVRKIASAGLCRTRTHGINLIDFSHSHFIRIIMDTGINYSLD